MHISHLGGKISKGVKAMKRFVAQVFFEKFKDILECKKNIKKMKYQFDFSSVDIQFDFSLN